MTPIEEKWQHYFGKHVDLIDFDDGTKNELRNIFFTGAISMYELVEESNKLTRYELAVFMTDLMSEMNKFSESIEKGKRVNE